MMQTLQKPGGSVEAVLSSLKEEDSKHEKVAFCRI